MCLALDFGKPFPKLLVVRISFQLLGRTEAFGMGNGIADELTEDRNLEINGVKNLEINGVNEFVPRQQVRNRDLLVLALKGKHKPSNGFSEFGDSLGCGLVCGLL